jgi:group I intron endonuclease
MNTGVYLIENTRSGKAYVGSTATSFSRRWATHRELLRRGRHHSVHLQRAWAKEGGAAFHFSVLEECEPAFCLSAEQYWINVLAPAYNISLVAGAPMAGRKHKLESKRLIGDSSRGKPLSEAIKRNMSLAQRGRTFSPEHRAKISKTLMGHKNTVVYERTPEHRARAAVVLQSFRRPAGWKHTPEAREKMSAAQIARQARERAGKGTA